MLLLSLFPGIGLLDMAFEGDGFCVVRGPDVLWGGDIHTFHPPPHRFDGIIGGPPCQAFSRLRHFVEYNGYETAPNLIPEFERVVIEAQPQWFLMENVPAAPQPYIDGYGIADHILNNRWFGGEQNRVRRFSFGLRGRAPQRLDPYLPFEACESVEWSPTVCASGGIKPGATKDQASSGKFMGWKTAEALTESIRLQGLPPGFLDDAPFTMAGKHKVVGNGVPLPLGRALAQAVKSVMEGMNG
jgi:DNA (cytosine-5)-methyltransferase 1